MKMIDLILKKKLGQAHTSQEIDWLIDHYQNGSIPDYQMSAWMMAVCFQGMTDDETIHLTRAMLNTGTRLDLAHHYAHTVDKHSTGGVGDTTSLIVGPIVAAAGCTLTKMSGRGLGHTGGTLDKLESIPGFRIELTNVEFQQQIAQIGLAIIGQTSALAPVDKKIYALRDVTATVQSIPLIASSIMSKKLAAGADVIALDIKVGNGAFMKTLEDGRQLAHMMVKIGTEFKRHIIVFLTDMNFPLGNAIGNSLEVIEAISILKGGESPRLKELCFELSAQMIWASGLTPTLSEAQDLVLEKVESGEAFEKFRQMVKAQGGDVAYLSNVDLFAKAPWVYQIVASKSGYITNLDALKIGQLAMYLGAGRASKKDDIDYSAGVKLCKHIGDYVETGEVLAELYTSLDLHQDTLDTMFKAALTISSEAFASPDLILAVIDPNRSL